MKKLIGYLFVFLMLAMPFGCSDDILTEVSRGNVTDDTFWNSESDFLIGLRGSIRDIGAPFAAYGLWQYVVEDLSTEYALGGYFSTTAFTSYSNWSSTTPDFISWGIWPHFWRSINKANTLIERLEESSLDEAVKNRIKGEAQAQRALAYFTLVKWFGSVPESTDGDESRLSIPRGTLESNFDLIESDLLSAIESLPKKSELVSAGESEYARLTQGSAQGLLAKVYLEQGKYAQCAAVTSELISSGEYSLMPNYTDIFQLENEGLSNVEALWTIAFKVEKGTEVQSQVLHPYFYKAPEVTSFSSIRKWGSISVTQDFYNSFDPSDQRRNGLFLSPSENQVMITKFPVDPTDETGRNNGNDYYFIRYADVLLMRAEALNEMGDLNGSLIELNKVRTRAGLAPLSGSGLDQEALKAQIFQERKWELYFEGHIRQDTKRMNEEELLNHIRSTSTDWERVGEERYLLLPFPAQALSSNPGLVQNEGF